MKQCLLKLLRPLNAFLILSQCAAAYTQCAAAYTHCAAAYTHCAAAYTHCAAAYMLCAAAYMVKVRIKLTQSSWAGAGTELGNKEELPFKMDNIQDILSSKDSMVWFGHWIYSLLYRYFSFNT